MKRFYPVFLFLLAIPFFFAVNRYNGIIIDGPLYVLQVINSMFPERFVGDIAFAYGNQDSFSLFTPLYRFFILQFGVEAGSRILCFLLQMGFAFAWALCIKVFWERHGDKKLLTSVALCFLCMGVYAFGMPLAQTEFLRFVESYAVSRLASVLFGILGIAFLLKDCKIKSLLFFLLGALMHPLMAGWGLPLWLFVYFPVTLKPVVVLSFLLPFSAFIGKGVLNFYPEGWLTRPFNFAPSYDDIAQFVIYSAFFGIFVRRMVLDDFLKKFAQAVAVVVGIAVYWWIWGGLAHHVFLYQVQCFRIEWICQVITLPLFVLLAYSRYKLYRISKNITTYDFALAMFALALFLPMHLIEFAVLGLVLVLRKERPLPLPLLQIVFLFTSLIALCYQTYLQMYLEGLPLIMFRNLSDAYRIADSLVLAEGILSATIAVYMFYRKRIELSIALVVFCILPSLQLLPLFVSFAWISPKIKRSYFVLLCLVAIAEGALNGGGRLTLMPIPGPFVLVLILWGVFAFCIIAQRKFKLSIAPILFFIITCLLVAFCRWDARPEEMVVSEKQMDSFVKFDIFEHHPEINDRGKVFYYVKGFAVAMPRLQFLNGGYYDDNSLTGAVFFEKQYREGNRRRNNLLLKNDDGELSDYAQYRNFAGSFLSQRDSLLDRVSDLCGKGEITHVVSDCDLPNVVLDSIPLDVMQKKAYLYSCEKKMK